MKVVKFIEHDGMRILRINFSNCRNEEYHRRIELAGETIRAEPENSVLTLTVLRGSEYTPVIMEKMKPYVAGNRPFVIAGAVVGPDNLEKILAPVNRVTSRKLRAFGEEEEALVWLVKMGREAEVGLERAARD